MTEEEARKKWCPSVRAYSEEGSSNRDYDGSVSKDALCVASDCMMWQDETSTNSHTGINTIIGGYCGLSNK